MMCARGFDPGWATPRRKSTNDASLTPGVTPGSPAEVARQAAERAAASSGMFGSLRRERPGARRERNVLRRFQLCGPQMKRSLWLDLRCAADENVGAKYRLRVKARDRTFYEPAFVAGDGAISR